MSHDQNPESGDSTPDQHIILHDGKWAIIPDGAREPIRVFDTRDDALN